MERGRRRRVVWVVVGPPCAALAAALGDLLDLDVAVEADSPGLGGGVRLVGAEGVRAVQVLLQVRGQSPRGEAGRGVNGGGGV